MYHYHESSGRCNTQVMVDSPVQYGSFRVTCPTCGVRNSVDVPLPPPRFISPSDQSQIVAMNYNEEMPTSVTNTMRMPIKRALLIGINYIGNRAQLRGSFCRTSTANSRSLNVPFFLYYLGCINDTKNVHRLLTETYGWEESSIKVLTDDLLDSDVRPTRANIILWMKWLAEDVRPGDVLFFFFSGISNATSVHFLLSTYIHISWTFT